MCVDIYLLSRPMAKSKPKMNALAAATLQKAALEAVADRTKLQERALEIAQEQGISPVDAMRILSEGSNYTDTEFFDTTKNQWREILEKGTKRMFTAIDMIEPEKLPAAMKIAYDITSTLSGRPSSISANVSKKLAGADPEEMRERLLKAKPKEKTIDAEVVE